MVEVLHHAGIELHLLAEDGPRRRREQHGIGHEPHALGERRPRGHDAELDLPLQSLLPDRVPPLVVLADVAIPPVPRQVVGIVRRLVRDVGEERLAVAAVGIDESDQLVGVGLRRVVVLGKLRQILPVLGEDRQRRRGGEVRHVPVAARAVEQREVALESPGGGDLVRLLAQVPLADHVGVIAGALEELWQRRHPVVEVPLVPDERPAGWARSTRPCCPRPFRCVSTPLSRRDRVGEQLAWV